MKDYMKCFIKQEDGVETIEFIGLVAVAAVLIGVIVSIGSKMATSATDSEAELNSALDSLKTIGQ